MTSPLVTIGPLRQVQPELETLLDAAIDGVVIIDHKGRIRLVSHAAEAMFGYREDELLGHNVSKLMPEPDRSQHDQYLQRYIAKREARIIGKAREVLAQRRDGSVFPAELAVGCIRNIEPPRFIAFIRDISERKQKDAALRRNEAALHTAQELANIGNYVIHFDAGAVDYASPQMMRMFGWETGNADSPAINHLAVRMVSVVHPADRPQVLQAFTDLDASGTPIDIEYRTLTSQSGLRYIHHLAQLVRDEQGRPIQHLGTVHDITDRRLADYEVQQMHSRITHSGRVSILGEMATGIAHEINQPLTAIATYAKACLRLLTNEECTPEELKHALEQISQQALRAGEVIRRMRSFVKYHDARIELTESNRLLEELVQLAQTDAHYHGVRVLLELAPESPRVRADPVQLQQVLLNLVLNAIDAMQDVPEPQREIVLRTRLDERGDVEFMVADRGSGVSPEIANELFNPFYTTKQAGTGLGLSISLSIIRSHGGKLWHADNPGGGARFFFALPRA